MNAWEANLAILEIVATGLGAMLDKVCFVGGATTALYLDVSQRKTTRGTEDVDCVVEIKSKLEYSALERTLENLGFQHDMTAGAPICRWKYQEVKVDIMPTDENILGFSNRWYELGLKNSIEIKLPSGKRIRIFSLLFFLVSKFEAFRSRGASDYLGSRDLEDIITVLDGRDDISSSISTYYDDVHEYLRSQFESLMGEPNFIDSLSGHLTHHQAPLIRARRVIEILQSLGPRESPY